ncbi:DNA topoisomerase type II [Aureococcus anophagefferens]|nr:DNA topoisomerase type II [Aureococcus anophagefferens]
MEPDVLPARVPVLLVNGAAGIAVGMATSIPPHNLGEVCDAALVVARAAKRGAKASDDELSVALPAPDFPTGGLIMGTTGVARAYATGQGSIVIRAKTHFEKVRSGRNAIVATELPYQVIKSELLAKTADAINARRIEGIADLRDESGARARVVFELKRDAQAEIVLSNLFKSTRLQTSFPANIVAVDHALNDDGDDVRSPSA